MKKLPVEEALLLKEAAQPSAGQQLSLLLFISARSHPATNMIVDLSILTGYWSAYWPRISAGVHG